MGTIREAFLKSQKWTDTLIGHISILDYFLAVLGAVTLNLVIKRRSVLSNMQMRGIFSYPSGEAGHQWPQG